MKTLTNNTHPTTTDNELTFVGKVFIVPNSPVPAGDVITGGEYGIWGVDSRNRVKEFMSVNTEFGTNMESDERLHEVWIYGDLCRGNEVIGTTDNFKCHGCNDRNHGLSVETSVMYLPTCMLKAITSDGDIEINLPVYLEEYKKGHDPVKAIIKCKLEDGQPSSRYRNHGTLLELASR